MLRDVGGAITRDGEAGRLLPGRGRLPVRRAESPGVETGQHRNRQQPTGLSFGLGI